MKKAVAGILLFVFVFNLVGYKALFFYLRTQADTRLAAEIERITESDKRLITVRVPIKLPYTPDKTEFEAADGEIESKGNIYKYVMWRIEKGELILLCIPNTEGTRIARHQDQFIKKLNLMAENKKKSVFKELKTDYCQPTVEPLNASQAFIEDRKYPSTKGLAISRGYPTLPAIPPIV